MTVDRWKCTSYCPCRPESRGHFEKSDEGVWVLRADHEAIIARQASAALAGMNAAKAISSNDVQRAARLRAESSPDALESERQANAKLTQELSLAEEGLANYAQENGQLRTNLDCANAELAWCMQCGRQKSAEVDRLRAALDQISTLLAGTLTGSTHWTGCEAHHPMCAIGRIVEETLRPVPQTEVTK